jgi:CRP/FNR family transcriptional activator FtrB
MLMVSEAQLDRDVSAAVMTPHEAIASAAWLGSVSDGTLGRLADQSVLHRMPPGSTLFEQAETPAFALLLVAGSVELLAVRGTQESLVEFVRAPDLLLPAAVLNRQPYLLRARVLDDARIVMIQADAFRQAVTSDLDLCLAVLACQAAQFRRQVKHAKNLQLRSAEERVGCYLLALAVGALPGLSFELPMEKHLIASQLGMTRETFSRILATVARHGLRVVRDRVYLEDVAAAHARFQLDPLLDGPEPMISLKTKKG